MELRRSSTPPDPASQVPSFANPLSVPQGAAYGSVNHRSQLHWHCETGIGMREGAMSNVRNWASSFIVAALVLLAPIIAFVMVVTAEMLTDLVAKVGGTAVWPVAAGVMGWVLLRKFGWQPRISHLRSEGA
jgi:hypothetical protein